jgi:hypothetical protein
MIYDKVDKKILKFLFQIKERLIIAPSDGSFKFCCFVNLSIALTCIYTYTYTYVRTTCWFLRWLCLWTIFCGVIGSVTGVFGVLCSNISFLLLSLKHISALCPTKIIMNILTREQGNVLVFLCRQLTKFWKKGNWVSWQAVCNRDLTARSGWSGN